MLRWTTLVIALLFLAIAAPGANAPASAQDGWITLFDGKNLNQWNSDGKAAFVIEDGAVTPRNKDDKITAYLVSKQSFKDFELRAEFWVSDDANSGIYIRVTDTSAAISSKVAYEANIFDTRKEAEFGTGALVPAAKTAAVVKTGGKWNTYEITAKGSRFTLVLNGIKTVDNAEDAKFAAGPIALQFGQGTVKFRKVQVRPL